MAHGTGSEVLAKELFEALVGAENASLPDINLFASDFEIPWQDQHDIFKPVEKISIEAVVSHFEDLMGAFKTPLQEEFSKNRITGAEYSRTYIALTQAAMQSAVQVALGKDQAFWMAARAQADAITAKAQLEVAKLQAMLARAQWANQVLQLANQDSAFGASELQRTEAIPAQIALSQEQLKMVTEQTEAQRAQTHDVRLSDGETVSGLLGKQKELYAQQKLSYIEDVKIKAAGLFADLWKVQKTISDVDAPTAFQAPTDASDHKSALDEIFENLRTTAGATMPYPPPTEP